MRRKEKGDDKVKTATQIEEASQEGGGGGVPGAGGRLDQDYVPAVIFGSQHPYARCLCDSAGGTASTAVLAVAGGGRDQPIQSLTAVRPYNNSLVRGPSERKSRGWPAPAGLPSWRPCGWLWAGDSEILSPSPKRAAGRCRELLLEHPQKLQRAGH